MLTAYLISVRFRSDMRLGRGMLVVLSHYSPMRFGRRMLATQSHSCTLQHVGHSCRLGV